MFELLVFLTLVVFFLVPLLYHFSTQDPRPTRQPSETQVVQVTPLDAKRAATALLNQSQVLIGAATLYANDHSGTYPSNVKDLENGRYLTSTVVPDGRVSRHVYRLVTGGDGRLVLQLELNNEDVCAAVAASAKRSYAATGNTVQAFYGCSTVAGLSLFEMKN